MDMACSSPFAGSMHVSADCPDARAKWTSQNTPDVSSEIPVPHTVLESWSLGCLEFSPLLLLLF